LPSTNFTPAQTYPGGPGQVPPQSYPGGPTQPPLYPPYTLNPPPQPAVHNRSRLCGYQLNHTVSTSSTCRKGTNICKVSILSRRRLNHSYNHSNRTNTYRCIDPVSRRVGPRNHMVSFLKKLSYPN